MKAGFPYVRIGPRPGTVLGKSSLWAASDHLLLVRNHHFTENYFRLYLRDIQAIIVRKHARFVVPLSAVYIALAMLIALGVGRLSHRAWVSTIASLVLLGGAAVWLAISFLWSCSCHIQTAVGIHQIPSLNRLWSARSALRLLENRIAEAQGTLPEAWEPNNSQPITRLTAHGRPIHLTNADTPAPLPPRPLVLGAAAIAGLFADALISWLVRRSPGSKPLLYSGLAITIFAVVMSVAAAVAARRYRRLSSFRTLLLITILAVGLANYGSVIFPSLGPAFATSQSSILGFFYWLNQVAEVGLGIIGVFLLVDVRGGEPSAP